MYTIVLSLVLACGPIKMINKTEFSWNDHDKKVLSSAKKVCIKTPKLPCVVVFVKVGQRNYRVLCGGEVKKDENTKEVHHRPNNFSSI